MPPRPKPSALPLLPLRAHPSRPATVAWAAGRCLFAYDTAADRWELRRTEAHTDTVRALDATTALASTGAARWVSSGDDKLVAIWDDRGGSWECTSRLNHTKKVTVAVFDLDGRVLYGDRFGDVYRWDGREDAEPLLLMSHLAIVTAMAVTEDGRYLITGDNGEKIRVSRYPEAAEIRSFCLGHTGHITGLLPLAADRLLSASADGTLRLWTLDGEPAAAPCQLGAPASCLCSVASGEAAVACEGGAGVRRVRILAGELEVLAPSLVDEAVQAVCPATGDGSVVWVDRRGHLRFPRGSTWADTFEGLDATPSLVVLSKCAGAEGGDGIDGGDEDGQEEGDDEAGRHRPARRRKT